MKVKVKVTDPTTGVEKIISRTLKVVPFGNFQMNIIRYNNQEWLVGDGDEYIRGGYDNVFTLGKNLGGIK